jgi:N-acetylglucosaminyl-diphospho-decaprenol L-rhamnosyltransferase
MTEFEKKITFVIVSYRSIDIIENCIRSINSNIKIIIIENSNDAKLKDYLEKKYSNVELFVANSNLGYGKANNFGITKVKTQYAFILNPDAYLDQNTLQELSKVENFLKEDFFIMAPNLNEYNNNLIDSSNKDFIQVDSVKGFAMLLNLKKINFNEIFDEKIFLFLEEIDLCKRIKNIGGKIYLAKKSVVYHLGKKSSEDNFSVELCRNWHWMWALYYYNKKHFGKLAAFKATFNRLLLSLIKITLSVIFMRKRSFLLYKYRIYGLLNAYLGKSSWLRPEMIVLKKSNDY